MQAFAMRERSAGRHTCWQLPRACKSARKPCTFCGEVQSERALMTEPRPLGGPGAAAVGKRLPPKGIVRLPIGRDEEGPDADMPGTVVGFVSCWGGATAGAESGGCSTLVEALPLCDASCTPGKQAVVLLLPHCLYDAFDC